MADNPVNATVVERHDLYDALSIMKVRPDSGVVPQFKPGQFCTLGLPPTFEQLKAAASSDGGKKKPRLVRRAYSIASSADVRDYLEVFVVLVEDGRLTPQLWTVQQNGRLWMGDKCQGHFTLDQIPPGKNLVMIATGTGLAPYVSMLRTYRARAAAGTAPLPWKRCVIIHGVRYVCDLGYRDELEQIGKEDPNVIYIPAVTREPEDSPWPGHRGRVQSILEPQVYQDLVGKPLSPEDDEVLLCGNPTMIDSVQKLLEGRGFVTATKKTPGNVHFERYW
ncbi:MAG: ferredoxin--NADP reductase [Phycisphaeraceae bacterium]